MDKVESSRSVLPPSGPGDPLEVAVEPDHSEEDLELGSEALLEMESSAYAREAIAALIRAIACSESLEVRTSALSSLVDIVESERNVENGSTKRNQKNSILVLQTWLEQFSRTNGGSSISEYASDCRVRLLDCLENILEHVYVSDPSSSFRAALARVIVLAADEMTRHYDPIKAIQKPCSKILVRIGRGDSDNRFSQVDKVMETLLMKYQPGYQSHYYVMMTLSELAVANPMAMVPFLTGLLCTMIVNMKSVKSDQLKFAYANAFSRFSESIVDYISNLANAPDPTVTESHFSKEIDLGHEFIFSNWLTKGGSSSAGTTGDFNVRHAAIEALGQMAPLLSDERMFKDTTQVVTVLITLYKRTGVIDPFYITQCISSLLKEMQNREAQIIDPILEPVLTALFLQVSQYSLVSTTVNLDEKRRNHFEVLRCYDVLIRNHHREKLLNGLLLRLSSVDDNIRLASLTVFKHLITSSLEEVRPRMKDIFDALHSKLSESSSNRVKSMLAQLTALLGRVGYLEGDEKGKDFLEFIVKLCALQIQPGPDEDSVYSSAAGIISSFLSDHESVVVTNANLREMCDNILRLLTVNVPAMDVVLWPHLLDYLLAPDFNAAVPSIVKCLSHLAQKKREANSPDYEVDYSNLVNVTGPQVVFARLIVLASVPFVEGRGAHILTFMQHFAANINKHLMPLWDQRIPLLLHYLETHANFGEGASNAWVQAQWEEWLLTLVKDTLEEVDLDEWTSGVATTLSTHLSFYSLTPEDACSSLEKLFLMRCLGRVLRSAKHGHHGQLILNNLSSLFLSTSHKDEKQRAACAEAYGSCAAKHLPLVLDKLENLLIGTDKQRRRGGSLFGLLRDGSKSEEEIRIATRATILRCVGESALHAEHKDLIAKVNEMTQKFVMPALQNSDVSLKLAALAAAADIALALQKVRPKPEAGTSVLVHHGDLIHEAIECMKSNRWMIKEKEIALGTALELVRLPPFVPQMTRCSLLKACFTAVFPCLIKTGDSHLNDPKQKLILDKLLKIVQALLIQELKQSTLDEIFTLIEPYLKLPESISREMAVIILQTSLQTFLTNYNFQAGDDSDITRDGFSPTPYIIGGIVPRCFDASRHVQTTSLTCLHILIRITLQVEKMSGKIISVEAEDQLRTLQALAASCSPLHASNHQNDTGGVTPGTIASTISDVLRRLVAPQHLHPLVTCLIDGLRDDLGGRGTGLVLCSLLESRGNEETLTSQTGSFMSQLHAKLLLFDSEELKGQTLMAIRLLAVHNHPSAVRSLLHDHDLPYDDAVVKIWKSFAQDSPLAAKIMRQILDLLCPFIDGGHKLDEGQIFVEERDRISNREFRVARRPYLSSIVALGILFSEGEMEKVVEGEFADVFVPLLFVLGCYAGVSSCEPRPRLKPGQEPVTSTSSFSAVVVPYYSASTTLQAFLSFFRGLSLQAVAEDLSQETFDARQALDFSKLVSALTENIILDFPSFTSKISSLLCRLVFRRQGENSALLSYHVIAVVAFFAQIVQTETNVDVSLIDTALEVLLAHVQHVEPNVRIICVQGISAFRIESIPHCTHLTKHAPAILRSLMTLIGEGFDHDVNFYALNGLARVLPALPDEVVVANLSEIVAKVFPFFDNSRKSRDSAAAMSCIASLADFVIKCKLGDFKEVFREVVVTDVLVSLVLRINDACEELRNASKDATLKVLATFEDEHLNKLGEHFNIDYQDFLKELAKTKTPKLRDFFPLHISRSVSYFRIGDPRIRSNAVLYLTSLLLDGQTAQDGVDCRGVCGAMSKLMTDASLEVQKTVAANMGKVLVHLKDILQQQPQQQQPVVINNINGVILPDRK